MKVIVKYTRWHQEHSLLSRICGDVLAECGDGTAWIKVEDIEKWTSKIAAKLVEIGFKKEDIEVAKFDGFNSISIVNSQEGWTISIQDCYCPDFYDMIYEIN